VTFNAVDTRFPVDITRLVAKDLHERVFLVLPVISVEVAGFEILPVRDKRLSPDYGHSRALFKPAARVLVSGKLPMDALATTAI
jgi:hypothetical protein